MPEAALSKTSPAEGAGALGPLLAKARNLAAGGDLAEAERLLAEAADTAPQALQVHRQLAQVRLNRGDAAAAYKHYKFAAARLAEDRDVWFEFALCLERMRNYEAAMIALQTAMRIGPETHEMYASLGRIHHGLGNSDECIRAYDAVLVMRPGNADAAFQRANALQMKGDFAAAREAYVKVLAMQPDFLDVHFRLAEMDETAGREDQVVEGLAAAASAPDESPARRATALFAAARIRRRQRRHDEAFELYVRANTGLRDEHPFNRNELRERLDRTVAAFRPEVFERHAATGDDTALPVFVVGMPRSGSTLLEQILSSHPAVGAAGEFPKMNEIETALRSASKDAKYRYPEDVAEIDPAMFRSLGESYLQALTERCPGQHARITDKFLFNFLHLGFIAIAFPRAAILHCRRDPRDVALSCLFQNFSSRGGLSFTMDLADIGFYIGQYRRLMRHWHAVLPGRIVDVDYEEVVADREAVSRKLITHLGLDWDEACLRPHENTRAVKTASFWQVRQPVYDSSVGAWRDYEAHLAPLLEELGQD